MFTRSTIQRAYFSLFLVAVIVAATPAFAQDRPFHVDANIGQASIDDIDGFSINESANAFRLGTGYRIFPWLGVSGAFVDFGNGTPMSVVASADGFEVTLAGYLPLSDSLSLTAQAGVLWWTGDTWSRVEELVAGPALRLDEMNWLPRMPSFGFTWTFN